MNRYTPSYHVTCVFSVTGAVAVDEEQKLLHQLQEITRVMQEGFVDPIPANAHRSGEMR